MFERAERSVIPESHDLGSENLQRSHHCDFDLLRLSMFIQFYPDGYKETCNQRADRHAVHRNDSAMSPALGSCPLGLLRSGLPKGRTWTR